MSLFAAQAVCLVCASVTLQGGPLAFDVVIGADLLYRRSYARKLAVVVRGRTVDIRQTHSARSACVLIASSSTQLLRFLLVCP